eukprot:CAMPEP_0198661878 /NCGR_PEP_ID=MMETSP1467-20131203/44588_1 /TAXON_ID=1462469 /ORGANISM="unid. sp., Strain CCMP2135" /LENGTH=282 /DNA_ID=CAMNT_0044398349 /DNA_START=10 /DNA_END=858 /DNA_ORIENTATION=-
MKQKTDEARKLLSQKEDESPSSSSSPQSTGAWWIVEDCQWAWRETKALFRDEWCGWESSVNPLYFALAALVWLSLVSGLWVHRPFDQGGPVRPDETVIEKEARIQWILMTDGPFALGFLTSLTQFALDPTDKPVMVAVGLAIDVLYVGGNVVFLEAMRQRRPLLTRLAIVANAVFAAGLVTILAFGVVWYGVNGHFTSCLDYLKWLWRALIVSFFVAAVFLYSKLWHAYDDDHRPPSSCRDDSWLHTTLRAAAIATAALTIWLLFFLAVFIDGPRAVWAVVG